MVVSFALTTINNIVGVGIPLYYTYKEINTPKKPIHWLSYWCLYTILIMLETFFESNQYSICKLFLTLLILAGDPEIIAELLISPIFSRVEKDIDQNYEKLQAKVFVGIKKLSMQFYDQVKDSQLMALIKSYAISSFDLVSNIEPYIEQFQKSYKETAQKNKNKKAVQLSPVPKKKSRTPSNSKSTSSPASPLKPKVNTELVQKPKVDATEIVAEKPATMPTPRVMPHIKTEAPHTPQLNVKSKPTLASEKKRA